MEWLCKSKGHNQSSLNMQHDQHSWICLIPFLIREEVAVQIISECLTITSCIWTWAHTELDTMTTRIGQESWLHCHYSSASAAANHFTLKMEATMSSKTLTSYHITTKCHNPDHDLNLYHCENLKSHTLEDFILMIAQDVSNLYEKCFITFFLVMWKTYTLHNCVNMT